MIWRRLEYDFLACLLPCLASYFSFFFSLFPFFFPASRYVYLLCAPSSVQHPSAALSKCLFYSTCSFCLCHLYPTPCRNFLVFIRSLFYCIVALISRVAFFFVVLSYPVRHRLICVPWFFSDMFGFLHVTVRDHRICISLWRIRKDTGGAVDVVG